MITSRPQLTEGQWNLAGSNLTNFQITRLKSEYTFWVTFVLSGGSAPNSNIKPISGKLFEDTNDMPFSCSTPIDLYIWIENSDTPNNDVVDNSILFITDFNRTGIYDELTNSNVDIDLNHYEIHKGKHFFYSRFHLVASGATINFVFEVGAKDVHFVYVIDSDFAGFTYSSYKDVTYTIGTGTLLDIRNNNPNFLDNLTTSKLILNPSALSTVGAKLYRTASKGTATNPAKSSGGSLTRDDEVILTAGSKWLLSITNKATAENPINVGMSWYEL